ncbi:hypothetical protein H5410_027511 [Solanum commersonii]|uniref:Uncharacterized protein n=1 Tax=Solanum commersonii TaxID=4109 RepID=A0A9J5YZD3_SOLCO|nr:hypothetical protein H5410_027511 [Solanum commersonii]
MSLMPGRHTCYNGRDKGSRSREGELTLKPALGRIAVATRSHEAESLVIARSAIRRRYLNRKEGMPKVGLVAGVKS